MAIDTKIYRLHIVWIFLSSLEDCDVLCPVKNMMVFINTYSLTREFFLPPDPRVLLEM